LDTEVTVAFSTNEEVAGTPAAHLASGEALSFVSGQGRDFLFGYDVLGNGDEVVLGIPLRVDLVDRAGNTATGVSLERRSV
jgi:hypothetical protein